MDESNAPILNVAPFFGTSTQDKDDQTKSFEHSLDAKSQDSQILETDTMMK
jgi:hypothetical protein